MITLKEGVGNRKQETNQSRGTWWDTDNVWLHCLAHRYHNSGRHILVLLLISPIGLSSSGPWHSELCNDISLG